MPTKPMGPPTETAAPVASDAAKNAMRCARTTFTPRAPAASAPRLSRFSGRASQANAANATTTSGSAASNRRVAGDVEVAHQPPQGAERLREVAEVLHEQDQRGEERVQRDAGQQQHRRREPAMPRRRQRVDDERRRECAPSRLAEATPPTAQPAPNVIASIAPSDAPAETPSVYGVASGLRSSPWNTTPAAASVPPTSAAASARGSRAMKRSARPRCRRTAPIG